MFDYKTCCLRVLFKENLDKNGKHLIKTIEDGQLTMTKVHLSLNKYLHSSNNLFYET
jgi:hypothetical protein